MNGAILVSGNSMVSFTNNNAEYGGAIAVLDFASIIIQGNTSVTFVNNSATDSGGALSRGHQLPKRAYGFRNL